MADQDWKTRVGVEINISSSSEEDEADGKGCVLIAVLTAYMNVDIEFYCENYMLTL